MRTTATALGLLAGLAVIFAGPVLANPLPPMPFPGIYSSSPVPSSPFPEGRATQSWELPANGKQGLGDVFNAESWNGAMLGQEWRASCGVQQAAQSRIDMRDASGTGIVRFLNTFNGGRFFLWKNGPWGDGLNDWGGNLAVTQSTVDVQYVNFNPVASVGNVHSSGTFDGGFCILTFVINNLVGKGDTDLLPKPPDYPVFLDPDCDPVRQFGSWGDVVDITIKIECPTPTRQQSWGEVKALYR